MRLRSLALSMVMAVPSLVFLAEPAFATHFRFGNITWQPRPDVSPTTVEFTLTAGFRRSGYPGSATDGRPTVGDRITEFIGGTRLFTGDGRSIGSPLQFEVIAINPTQDWLLAKAERTGPGDPDKVLLHTYPSTSNGGSPWVAQIDTCCRITTSDHINNSSGNYRVETLVDLRSLNGPPITSLPPIVSCELDSVCQFVIPASDANGDPIRFRLATSCEAAAGCGFVQPGPPHAPNALSIDATTGIATWDTTNARIASGFGYGLYSAQVIVEDLGSDGAAKSKTAVDFLIRVAPAPPFAPRFDSPPSPPQGAVFNIGRGETLTIPLQASDPESGDVVTLGDAGLPVGMVCTYGAPSNPVSGSCTWSPSATQSGNHLVVFTATDNHGVGAPPLSVTVLIIEDFAVTDIHSNEPHMAVDPNDDDHAVVGFNDLTSSNFCGWAESRDGGRTWGRGSLRFPPGFRGRGDPWVRYGPDGHLFYSCIGVTEFKSQGSPFYKRRDVGIFVAKSGTGLAGDLEVATAVTIAQQHCPVKASTAIIGCEENSAQGLFADHPAIAVLSRPDGFRVVVCWVDIFDASPNSFVSVSYSDDGSHWSKSKAIGGASAAVCTIGGSSTQVGVSWWDYKEGSLKLRTSVDGVNWTRAITKLANVGDLVVDGERASTTSRVLSVPYALIVGEGSGLRAYYQVRTGDHSQVYVADSDNGWQATALGEPNSESFIPGAGTCPDIVGFYRAKSPTDTFTYTMWRVDGDGSSEMIFESTHGMDGADGDPDQHSSFHRIGDYNGAECGQEVYWSVWTDTRQEDSSIWGTILAR